MRFMVMVKATEDSEASAPPTKELLDQMMAFNRELMAAGVMKGGDGLTPSSKGVRVRFDGASRSVIDGPFAETNELVAGYWLWECASLEEAISWVKRCPNPMPGPSEIEIRQIGDLSDFGDIVSPDVATEWQQMKREAGESD